MGEDWGEGVVGCKREARRSIVLDEQLYYIIYINKHFQF